MSLSSDTRPCVECGTEVELKDLKGEYWDTCEVCYFDVEEPPRHRSSIEFTTEEVFEEDEEERKPEGG